MAEIYERWIAAHGVSVIVTPVTGTSARAC
jgi:hypothetical protein